MLLLCDGKFLLHLGLQLKGEVHLVSEIIFAGDSDHGICEG